MLSPTIGVPLRVASLSNQFCSRYPLLHVTVVITRMYAADSVAIWGVSLCLYVCLPAHFTQQPFGPSCSVVLFALVRGKCLNLLAIVRKNADEAVNDLSLPCCINKDERLTSIFQDLSKKIVFENIIKLKYV